MEARHRLVRVSVGPIGLGAAVGLLVAVTLFVLITLHSVPTTTLSTPPVAPSVVTSPEEAAK